jgi:hypothetical protein
MAPEDNPADDVQPTQEEWEEYEQGHGRFCVQCDRGWLHGCCDDMCRNCEEAVDCPNAWACKCNPDGDVP